MKQRLLLTLLVLFASVGMVKADANTIVMSIPASAGDVVVTYSGGTEPTLSEGFIEGENYTVSGSAITIKSAGTPLTPTITLNPATKGLTFKGNITSISIDHAPLASLTFSSARVNGLTVTSSSLKTLKCSELGLTSLTLTGATALEELNASDNKLIALAGTIPTSLKKLDISKNAFATFDPSSLVNLTDLNVSNNALSSINVAAAKLTKLVRLNLSGNKIKNFAAGESPDTKCSVIWGVQTISATGDSKSKPANVGINVKALIKDALGLTAEPASYSSVKWMIKDGDVYVADPNTAHLQTPTYPNEYRFYNNSTKVFVDGTYQCTVTVDGRTYNIEGIEVKPAEFTLSWTTPANASALAVTKGGSGVTNGDVNNVKQGDVLLFQTTMDEGYDKVVYTIEGLKPANGLVAPYAYNPFRCTVEGKYKDVANSEVPKISAVVSGAKHTVKYEASDVSKGGTFTVEKQSKDGSKVALNSGDDIATGDKLIVTILPNASYTGTLYINNTQKTIEGGSNVYSYTVENSDKDFNIAVTFTKDQVKIEGIVDGQAVSGVGYIAQNQLIVDGNKVVKNEEVLITKNADHQVEFTIDQRATADNYRVLDVVTINGGDFKSVTSKASSDPTGITYTVSFTTKSDDVIVSIKTKTVKPVTIKLVKNAATGDAGNDKQEQIYSGKSLPLLFTTEPAGLESQVEVTYAIKDGGALGTTAPIGVGDYTATLTFKETSNYVLADPKAADLTNFPYSIAKAPLSIHTLPKVTVTKAGEYEISGGKVMFGNMEIAGTFKVRNAEDNADITAPESPANKLVSHNVKVLFTPKSTADQANYTAPTATVIAEVADSKVDKVKVSIYSSLPTGVKLEFYNGNKLVNPSTESFIAGTVLTGVVTYPVGASNIKLVATSLNTGTTVDYVSETSVAGRGEYTITLGTMNTQFNVTADAAKTYKVELKKQTVEYNGEPQEFNTSKDFQMFDKDGENSDLIAIITYKDKSGNQVPLPINAGEYTVCVKIEADGTKGYAEYTKEFAGAFVIEKTRAIVYTWPTASPIAKGMPLSQSALSEGAANIPGTFDWENGKTVPPIEGGKYKAVFTPNDEYIMNYEKVITPTGTDPDGDGEVDKRIEVKVSNLQIVTFAPKNGTVTVVNQDGTSLVSGSAVSKGNVLTITATPDEGFELGSLTVNDKAYSGKYTVGETSLSIVATFKLKESFDPNTQFTVTLPEADAVRGVIINKPGVNAVTKGGSFAFTLSMLASDSANVVVTVDGAALTPVDGTYTIAKVDGNKTVSVALANPTKIKVTVEKETKNANNSLMGKVEITGLAADSTCYYGDEVTIVAFPESGVNFDGWSGAITSTGKLATFTVTQAMTIKPKFSGIPTGNEKIETPTFKILGGEGYIFITCDSPAKVIIIHMDGRSKVENVNGETRIPMPAGIYGVVLQQGSKTLKKTVSVR